MIFERALRRELSHSATGIFIALFAIMATTQLIRLLNEALGGRVAPEAVAALLGFAALQYLPVLLGLTMFIALLLTLSRHYRDSEMVIWFVSGNSLFSWVRPVFRFAAPIIAVIAVLSFFVTPWSLFKSVEYRQNLSKRSDATHVAPGSFREAPGGDRIVFVEKIDPESGQVKGVFVRAIEQGQVILVVAERGRRLTGDNGDQFLLLEGGRRYEVIPGQPELRQVEFASYAVRIEIGENVRPTRTTRQLSTPDLLRAGGKSEQAELLWRIGLPVSALVLALMAIPLSYANPRSGKSLGIVVALLTFLTYNNMQSVVQSWVAQGRLSFALGWWPLHALVVLVSLLLIWRRVSIRSWSWPWR
jgi:lipopolysaccharide export system permease protein